MTLRHNEFQTRRGPDLRPVFQMLRAALGMILLTCGACALPPKPESYTFRGTTMGGTVLMILCADRPEDAEMAAAAAFARLDALDRIMSDYRPESELMRFSAVSGRAIAVSDDLFRVLDRSIQVARATDGAFDPTIGPVVRLWREARRTGELPSSPEIAEAMTRIGYRLMTLDPGARTVTLHRPGMQLDLGGIGKGFGADEALRTLRAHGITSALVDLGGDIALGDPPPNKAGWSIAIDPVPDGAAAEIRTLSNVGVATSSDQVQFIELGGVRYSHIVDPRTGLGVTNRFSVVVIAPDAATADALASAFSVLGDDAPDTLAEAFGAEVIRSQRK